MNTLRGRCAQFYVGGSAAHACLPQRARARQRTDETQKETI